MSDISHVSSQCLVKKWIGFYNFVAFTVFADHVAKSISMTQNTMAFNVTGHPALSINAGWSGNLPIGMMIVGKHWDDVTVLKVARAHEKLTTASK